MVQKHLTQSEKDLLLHMITHYPEEVNLRKAAAKLNWSYQTLKQASQALNMKGYKQGLDINHESFFITSEHFINQPSFLSSKYLQDCFTIYAEEIIRGAAPQLQEITEQAVEQAGRPRREQKDLVEAFKAAVKEAYNAGSSEAFDSSIYENIFGLMVSTSPLLARVLLLKQKFLPENSGLSENIQIRLKITGRTTWGEPLIAPCVIIWLADLFRYNQHFRCNQHSPSRRQALKVMEWINDHYEVTFTFKKAHN